MEGKERVSTNRSLTENGQGKRLREADEEREDEQERRLSKNLSGGSRGD